MASNDNQSMPAQDGLYAGEDQGSYKLPVCNVDENRRNFTGYEGSKQYYTLEDIQKGDESGSTDTDYFTHKYLKGESGYTSIYQRHGNPVKGKSGSMGQTTGKVAGGIKY